MSLRLVNAALVRAKIVRSMFVAVKTPEKLAFLAILQDTNQGKSLVQVSSLRYVRRSLICDIKV